MKRIWGENYEGKKLVFFSHKADYEEQVSNVKKELEKRTSVALLLTRT